MGAVRDGSAPLVGLLACGRCGAKMTVHYQRGVGQLSVSPKTVNAHTRSIYAKLGVGDRSSAVRRARELRLLAAGRRGSPAVTRSR